MRTVGYCKKGGVRVGDNDFWTTCSNFTMIQRLTNLGSLFYSDRFECMREKRGFWERKKGKQIPEEERESVESCVVNIKSDLLRLYL